MVDREARDKMAELLRHFAAGQLSVDDWEEAVERRAVWSKDDVLWEVFHRLWFLYDDFRTDTLTGEWALVESDRRSIARAILFLQSDCEWEPPPVDYWASAKLGVCGLLRVLASLATPVAAFLIPLQSVELAGRLCGISSLGTGWVFAAAFLVSASIGVYPAYLAVRTIYRLLFCRPVVLTEEEEQYRANWPFQRPGDLAEALAHPRLLCGGRRA